MKLYPEFKDGVQNGRLNLKNSNKSSNIHPNDVIFMSIPGFSGLWNLIKLIRKKIDDTLSRIPRWRPKWSPKWPPEPKK